MDKKVQGMWTSALTSGEYPQIRGRMRNSEGYCPLGVLCELYRMSRGGEWHQDPRDFNTVSYGFILRGIPHTNYLPAEVSRWAGLTSCDPSFFDEGSEKSVTLASLGDSGASFSEIAQIIAQRF